MEHARRLLDLWDGGHLAGRAVGRMGGEGSETGETGERGGAGGAGGAGEGHREGHRENGPCRLGRSPAAVGSARRRIRSVAEGQWGGSVMRQWGGRVSDVCIVSQVPCEVCSVFFPTMYVLLRCITSLFPSNVFSVATSSPPVATAPLTAPPLHRAAEYGEFHPQHVHPGLHGARHTLPPHHHSGQFPAPRAAPLQP
jgi:hypothetical protein